MTNLKEAAAVRELYLTHKLSYAAAHAQLTVFFGMGAHEADVFLHA